MKYVPEWTLQRMPHTCPLALKIWVRPPAGPHTWPLPGILLPHSHRTSGSAKQEMGQVWNRVKLIGCREYQNKPGVKWSKKNHWMQSDKTSQVWNCAKNHEIPQVKWPSHINTILYESIKILKNSWPMWSSMHEIKHN